MEWCMKFKDKVVVITGAAQGLGQSALPKRLLGRRSRKSSSAMP